VTSAPVVSVSPVSSSPLPTTVIGYYSWNWVGTAGPSNANIGVAFTGYADVDQAIAGYTSSNPALKGVKYISLGGGNHHGAFTVTNINAIATKLQDIISAGYGGVMYDVEEVTGPHADVITAFANSFQAVKNAGLMVAVTTSHSAPYHTDTPAGAAEIVKAWASDANVDILSPQLYTSGLESSPDYAETDSCKNAGCLWSLYKGANGAKFAPSIVEESHYAPIVTYFSTNYQIDCEGYFIWKQL